MSFFSTTELNLGSTAFYGRQFQLDWLVRLCGEEDRKYGLLYGAPQTGKTSLLVRLQSALTSTSTIRVCWIDFQQIQSASPAQAFSRLATKISEVLPEKGPQSVTDGSELNDYLHQGLQSPEISRLVLLVEKFEALPVSTSHELGNAFRALFKARSISPYITKLQIVLFGGIDLYDLVRSDSVSLDRICEQQFLPDLSQSEAVALVSDGMKKVGVTANLSNDLALEVYEQMSGHTFLTQSAGELLEGYHTRGETLTLETVRQVAKDLRSSVPLLRRIPTMLQKYALEDSAVHLLKEPLEDRHDDSMMKLELLGLAKYTDGGWKTRNRLVETFLEYSLNRRPSIHPSGSETTRPADFVLPLKAPDREFVPVIPIAESLLEQFEDGNVVVFVGEEVSANVLPTSAQLAEDLARQCDYPLTEQRSLPRVAGYYVLKHKNDRSGLVRFLSDKLSPPLLKSSRTHQLIAFLNPQVIVSACYDKLLEQALLEISIPYIPIAKSIDVANIDEKKTLLFWLCGVFDQPDSLVITEDDRQRFTESRGNLSAVLRGELARRTWLFLGFNAADQWSRTMYGSLTSGLDRQWRPPYLVGTAPSGYDKLWWEERNTQVINASIDDFLESLLWHLQERRLSKQEVIEHDDMVEYLPEEPYKLLDSFDTKDEAIYFGREHEKKHLANLIHARRLTLVYGASGVGKTSLILAGVAPRLERANPPYLTIYVRALTDPAQTIKHTLRRVLNQQSLSTDLSQKRILDNFAPEYLDGQSAARYRYWLDQDFPKSISLADYLSTVTAWLPGSLVIILDQFEEFFIRHSPEVRADFINDLGDIYEAKDLPVKIIISLREDWLYALSELELRIPEIFYNYKRVLPLTRDQARRAIVSPADRLGITYDPKVVDRLLEELGGSVSADVLPPQLQIVCGALYRNIDERDKVITSEIYDSLGGVSSVLQQYLRDELARLPHDDRILARRILEELITSEGTKAVKTLEELNLAGSSSGNVIESILERLIRARLVRVLEDDYGKRSYELVHEYLIREIELTTEAQQRKQAEELIGREVENWRRFRDPIPLNRLSLIYPVREQIRIGDEALQVILLSILDNDSASINGEDVAYWLSRANEPFRIVTAFINSKNLLGLSTLLDSLRLILLRDTAKCTPEIAISILPLLKSENEVVCSKAMDVLKQVIETNSEAAPLEVARAVNPLIDVKIDAVRIKALEIAAKVCEFNITITIPDMATALWRSVQQYESTRSRALNLLRQIVKANNETAKQIVTELLNASDGNEAVQSIATESLRQVIRGNEFAIKYSIDLLLSRLNEVNAYYRPVLMQTLCLLIRGNDAAAKYAMSELHSVLKHSNIFGSQIVRSFGQVVVANATTATVEVADTLQTFLSNPNPSIRSEVAKSLGQFVQANASLATPALADSLHFLLEDSSIPVREASQESLIHVVRANEGTAAYVGDLWSRLLLNSYEVELVKRLEVLQKFVDTNPMTATRVLIKTLSTLLSRESKNRILLKTLTVFRQAIEKMAPVIDLDTVRVLEGLLRIEDEAIRVEILRSLHIIIGGNTNTSTKELVDTLLSVSLASQGDLSDEAVKVLAQVALSNPDLAHYIIDATLLLRRSEKDVVRDKGLSILRQIVQLNDNAASYAVRSTLPELRNSISGSTRIGAIETLRYVAQENRFVASPEMVARLLPLLRDPDDLVRLRVIESLRIIVGANSATVTEELVDALQSLLRDKNKDVSRAANTAWRTVNAARSVTGTSKRRSHK